MQHVLERVGDNLTRENLMKQAASIRGFWVKMLLPGITASTSASDFYPVEAMQMQRFDGKGWQRFGDIVRAESS
jgi:branched-chain amino acid transport system substrate-binding protein